MNLHSSNLRNVVTSELKAGDIVCFYGATYRLIEDARPVGTFGNPNAICPDDIQCYRAKRELVEGCAFLSVPTWWFQGNDRASWSVLIEC